MTQTEREAFSEALGTLYGLFLRSEGLDWPNKLLTGKFLSATRRTVRAASRQSAASGEKKQSSG